MAGAAQISFVADGGVLAITEKATNKIITYRLDAMGKPNVMHSITSSTPTPFGFAVGKDGIIYVSEAVGGTAGASVISSYRINGNGTIKLLDGSVGAGQTAACWVVITNNGKYIYDTNTGSNNLSSFTTKNGDLSVLKPIAAATGPGTSPIDAALSVNSKFLYVLNSGNETISVFVVENDGELTYHQTLSGLPNGATGMAAK
jgi:6-phosphogluconolactonase (cycloisomerase 2 family)